MPIDSLRAPRDYVDMSTEDAIDRWNSVYSGTKAGAAFDPIVVTPAPGGIPIGQVGLDPFGGK